ncbi:MAG: transporter [Calditrichaceae bacterium]|jgi:hypothetical protein
MKIPHILLVMGAAIGILAAQSPYEMEADRPDVTETPYTVLSHRLQIEAGFRMQNDGDLEILDLGDALFRYGLTRSLELRAGASFRRETLNDVSYDGLAGVEVGVKFRVFRHIRSFPDAGLIISGILPVGDDRFAPSRFSPKAILALAHKLNRRLSMGYNIGGYWPNGRNLTILGSASLGIWIAGPFSAFVEGYAESPNATPTQVLLDAGLIISLARNFQLDFAIGGAVNEEAPDRVINIGFAWRLPR